MHEDTTVMYGRMPEQLSGYKAGLVRVQGRSFSGLRWPENVGRRGGSEVASLSGGDGRCSPAELLREARIIGSRRRMFRRSFRNSRTRGKAAVLTGGGDRAAAA